jgi:quercetin dioxygenase-like cupin family protein
MPPRQFYAANILSALTWAPAHVFPGVLLGMAISLAGASADQLTLGRLLVPTSSVCGTKLAAGLKVMPHWHPDEWRTAVVLSGTLYFGLGEQWDESKLKAYPAGTFYSEPPKTPHFVWAKDGEVILQTTGMGQPQPTPSRKSNKVSQPNLGEALTLRRHT